MKGRFGVHGGQYVPETLMNALIEVDKAYEYYKNDAAFTDELQQLIHKLRGPSVAIVLCRAHDKGARRREDIPQARGFEPYGLAQDQQRFGSGAA